MLTSRRKANGRRALTALFSGVLAAAGMVAATAVPAAAAIEVGTLDELQTVVGARCPSDVIEVALTGDISDPGAEVAVNCDVRLDLDGHDLTVRNIGTETDTVLTIDDDTSTPGILTADASGTGFLNGPQSEPGVPGIETTYGGLNIDGGVVVAKGGVYSAGIGGIAQGPGTNITIGGTADVTAAGGYGGAGIGGGTNGAAKNITVTGDAQVSATSGTNAAGIGAGARGSCFDFDITINGDAVVSATSVSGGAGIGSGYQSSNTGCDVVVEGSAQVSAKSLGSGAGIGGGVFADGGDLRVGVNAIVTASGWSAVGSGAPLNGRTNAFGSLQVDGTLRLPTGQMRVQDSNTGGPEVTVGADGVIEGGTADPTAGAQLSGGGQIDNGGAVLLAANLVTGDATAPVTVTDRHYRVSFDTVGGSADPADVTVFATSATAGARDFPADPTRDGAAFLGWNTAADGTGTAVEAGTDLTVFGSSTNGSPVAVPLFAQWSDSPPDGEIDTIGELQDAVASPCADGTAEVVLAGDIDDPTAEMTMACDVDLDLSGHDLTIRDIIVSSGTVLTIDDSTGTPGTVTADASSAGVPGIETTGARLDLDGGQVVATGGSDSAGIGGGSDGSGGVVRIGVDADVTSTGGYTAIGSGRPMSGKGSFGSLQVDGTLRLPTGEMRVQDSDPTGPEVTVGATGTVRGSTADPTEGAQLSGGGQVDNGGAILLATSLVTGGSTPVTVTGRHYRVSFDTTGGSTNPADVTVFATSATVGARDFPPDPTWAGRTFLGWNAASDGSGAVVEAAADLTGFGDSAAGVPVPVPLYAQWSDVPPAGAEVDTVGELQDAVTAPCVDGVAAVVLAGDFSDPEAEVSVACDVDLDLNGHDLAVRDIVISPDTTLTIDDGTSTTGTLTANASRVPGVAGIGTTGATLNVAGGHVVANGGYLAAGIGGGARGDSGGITVGGSADVSASGGFGAAGIGGGWGGDGSQITVGGTVEATGGFGAAGIGGGFGADGRAITVDGSAEAFGGFAGAGIGGGWGGDGSQITIGGTVEATGGFGAAGIGGGFAGDGSAITVNGSADVSATGGFGGAGIGPGWGGRGSDIVIDGSAQVIARGGFGGADVSGG